MMKHYVVGLVFDIEMKNVLLLHRKKEPYQGLYNGVGGKVEQGENSYQAMIRELEEETGFLPINIKSSGYVITISYDLEKKIDVYYFVLNESEHRLPIGNVTNEGVLVWLNISENHLLDASHPEMAGDGNIAYFIQYAHKLEKDKNVGKP
ncbi:NUDIX domain-containing protein [Fredinandcohnia sp. 179-A 10B2 NHS]|uniref:NUDIX domain-containing protein n=1 Tax=Fredinandcohnia sp. 179-A 10B2 NHS TaxID=3235176 RepID=UPI0039A1D6DB